MLSAGEGVSLKNCRQLSLNIDIFQTRTLNVAASFDGCATFFDSLSWLSQLIMKTLCNNTLVAFDAYKTLSSPHTMTVSVTMKPSHFFPYKKIVAFYFDNFLCCTQSSCSRVSLCRCLVAFGASKTLSSLHTMTVYVPMKSSRTSACNPHFFPYKNNCRILLQQFSLLYTVRTSRTQWQSKISLFQVSCHPSLHIIQAIMELAQCIGKVTTSAYLQIMTT